jgi:uncharacterized protein YndB with AHSA1/START domain
MNADDATIKLRVADRDGASDERHPMTTITDRIERSIEIAAPAERVWALVSEPGWWINDGVIRPHRIERDGKFHIVHDDEHGEFAIEVHQLDAPRYAAFRWAIGHRAARPVEGAATLVEFFIDDTADGVVLRVVESGFAGLSGNPDQVAGDFAENSAGWETELTAARTAVLGR